MKKQEMIDTLQKQGDEIKKELNKMQEAFTQRREQLVRIEGALEALSIVELDDAPPATDQPVDHSDAAMALAAAGM